MSAPLVTVLLPVFNGGALLRPCLDSVLSQTFADFELLAVDDGSSDETPEVLRGIADARLRVLTNERNLGLTRSLNRGLAEARGTWIARQDADDLCAPERLARQLAFLHENPRTALLGTAGWRLDPQGRVTGSNDLPTTALAIRWANVTDNPFLHTSVMFSREAALAEGGYDERFAICQDFDLWSRLAERRPVANLRERLVAMREHPASMTRTQSGGTTDEASTVLVENWARIFPGRRFTDEEARLLRSFRLRFPAEEWSALSALLGGLFAEFCERHPEAKICPEVRAMRARQALRVAYKFIGSARGFALREMQRAVALAPGEAWRQVWTVIRARAGLVSFPEGSA